MKGETAFKRFCYKSKANFKYYSPTILSAIAAGGVVVTTILAVKATPKALELLDTAKEAKEEPLTKMEVVKIAAPSYIPTAISGLTTILCIFGADAISRRQKAALLGAYTLVSNAYKEYRLKVKELLGEETDRQIQEEIKKKLPGDKILFYDMHMGEYFESDIELVTLDDGLEVYVVNTSSIF